MIESTISPIDACICECGAETAIIDMLVDNNLLVFTREQMLNEEVIRCRSAKVFEQRYLRKEFKSKITVLRVLDSHSEGFRLSPAYEHKVDNIINVVTSPEIEMLLMMAEDNYEEYMKKSSSMSPSVFCKQVLKMKDKIKSREFVREYFADIDMLVSTIQEYKKKRILKKGEIYLADLLK